MIPAILAIIFLVFIVAKVTRFRENVCKVCRSNYTTCVVKDYKQFDLYHYKCWACGLESIERINHE